MNPFRVCVDQRLCSLFDRSKLPTINFLKKDNTFGQDCIFGYAICTLLVVFMLAPLLACVMHMNQPLLIPRHRLPPQHQVACWPAAEVAHNTASLSLSVSASSSSNNEVTWVAVTAGENVVSSDDVTI